MNPTIRFDDSLPAFAGLVEKLWGRESTSTNIFLRDATGRLTFVLLRDAHSLDDRARLASAATLELGGYVDGSGFSVATPEELFDDTLKDLDRAAIVSVDHQLFKGDLHIVDRRMVGADWLVTPVPGGSAPVRFVFASLKGGVGRSTALCVLAAHLAAHGKRILAIDMDLEAPGLGNLLLPDSTLPEFGLLDYLVESEVGNAMDDQFFADMIGPSWLGGGLGRVDVIPAIGQRSLHNPSNVLAKIARGYLASPGDNGSVVSFSDRIRTLVDSFADPVRYDAILIDARAGLHETTAVGIVGLGAEVFFFGQDQPQTFAGYELLFAHLSTLLSNSTGEWPSQFHLIQSKAPKDTRRRSKFAENMGDLFGKYLLRKYALQAPAIDPSELKDTFDVDWADENTPQIDAIIYAEDPSPVIAILDDNQFRSFDPLANRDVLEKEFYALAFGEFLERAEMLLASAGEMEPQ